MEDLNKLVYDHLVSKKGLSNDDYEKIAEIIVNEYELENLVKKVRIAKLETSTTAQYSRRKGIIELNEASISRFINIRYGHYKKIFPNISYNQFKLYYQMVIILHELRHAIQNKLSTKYNGDKPSNLIRHVITDSITAPLDDYNKYYNLFPTEKDADVFGYAKTLESFLDSKIINNEELYPLAKIYLKVLNYGYVGFFNDASLEDFYKKVVNDYKTYKEYEYRSSCLETIDKISFNFSLNAEDKAIAKKLYDSVDTDSETNKVLQKHMFRK